MWMWRSRDKFIGNRINARKIKIFDRINERCRNAVCVCFFSDSIVSLFSRLPIRWCIRFFVFLASLILFMRLLYPLKIWLGSRQTERNFYRSNCTMVFLPVSFVWVSVCVCACCGRRFGHFIWWMCGASATVYSFSFDDCLIAIASRSRPRFFFLFSFRCVLDNVQAHELVHHVFCSSLCFVCVACVRRTCCSWADAETNITWSISTCAIFSASLAFERTLALDKKKTPKKKKDKKVAAALAWDYFYYI